MKCQRSMDKFLVKFLKELNLLHLRFLNIHHLPNFLFSYFINLFLNLRKFISLNLIVVLLYFFIILNLRMGTHVYKNHQNFL